MRKVITTLVLAGAFAVTACGGSKESAAVKEYKKIVKAACECKDADCAGKVDKQEQDWRMKNYKDLSKGDKEAMAKSREEFTKCRDKAKGGS